MVYAPTFTLSIPDCTLGMPSAAQRDATNRRSAGAPSALRTVGAALINRTRAYRLEVLHVGWRSFMHSQTAATTPSAPLGELRRISACSGGVLVSGVPHDTSNATLPSQVEVRRWGTSTATSVIKRFAWAPAVGPLLATSLPPNLMTVPILGDGLTGELVKSTGSVAPMVLREGEGLSVYTPHNVGNGATLTALGCGPWTLRVSLRVVGTGAIFDYQIPEVVAGYENCAACIFNGSGSGVILEVLQVLALQTASIATGYATPEAPKVGVFHVRKNARVVVDVDGFVRDVSSGCIVPHDSTRALVTGVEAYAGAMPFDMFEHADPSALGFSTTSSSPAYEGGNDMSSVGRIRRCYPWTCPRGTAFGPLHIHGFGQGGDVVRSRAAAAGAAEPILLVPGEAIAVGHAMPTPGFHSQESATSTGGWAFYIGDVEVMFRVLPVRGKPDVRAA